MGLALRGGLRTALTLLIAAVLAACPGGSSGDATLATDTLTRRQKDSIIADMPVPGARGVGKALDVLGRTQDRATAHDSIR